jgi:HrpA-like RNA helicase
LNEFPVPEILRSPLDAVLLQIYAHAHLRPLSEFEFVQTPDVRVIHSSLLRLLSVGALSDQDRSLFWRLGSFSRVGTESGVIIQEPSDLFERTMDESEILKITPLGRVLSTLPVDVVIGRMLVLALVSLQNAHEYRCPILLMLPWF